jgi:hypothetical protein
MITSLFLNMSMAIPSLAQLKNSGLVKNMLLVSSICGAVVTIYNFGGIWDRLGLPRPVFVHEHQAHMDGLRNELRALEISYRERAIATDQKRLLEIERDILLIQSQRGSVPDGLLDMKGRLEESLRIDRERLATLTDDK